MGYCTVIANGGILNSNCRFQGREDYLKKLLIQSFNLWAELMQVGIKWEEPIKRDIIINYYYYY